MMRLLVGYDGSESARLAAADLARAGLGNGLQKTVQARVVSVMRNGDVVLGREPAPPDPARLNAATDVAADGAKILHALNPGWAVTSEAMVHHSVHGALISEADRWPADLLVIGSHARGAVGRLIHGSVAQMCVNYAETSIRVARLRPQSFIRAANDPVNMIVGIDGSPASEAALREVARRHWPRRSHAWVVHVVEPDWIPLGASKSEHPTIYTGKTRRELVRLAARTADQGARILQATGLSAVPLTLEGYPARELIQSAERECADCIILGATGHGAMERFILGSVASAVAMHAHCSVEVIRPREGR